MAMWKQEKSCLPERCCGSHPLGPRPLGLLLLFSTRGAGRCEGLQAWRRACRWPYASTALGANPLRFADGEWGGGGREDRIDIPIPKRCCKEKPGRSIPWDKRACDLWADCWRRTWVEKDIVPVLMQTSAAIEVETLKKKMLSKSFACNTKAFVSPCLNSPTPLFSLLVLISPRGFIICYWWAHNNKKRRMLLSMQLILFPSA